MALQLTYELYLHAGDETPVFEALTCHEVELVGAMRRLIDERGLRAIEAHRMGEHVLTLHA